jgi:uncharacterized membrane protein YkvA (DUF1232 family)
MISLKQSRSFIYVLYYGLHDSRVAWYMKVFAILIIAYVISPIDIIPDFIPVIGLLDEAIIIPVAVAFVIHMIPDEVVNDYRNKQYINGSGLKILGIVIVISIWLTGIMVFYLLWLKFSVN